MPDLNQASSLPVIISDRVNTSRHFHERLRQGGVSADPEVGLTSTIALEEAKRLPRKAFHLVDW